MSELERLKTLAQGAGIDADALLGELKEELLADSQQAIQGAVKEIQEVITTHLGQFREEVSAEVSGQVESRVNAGMNSLLEAAKKEGEKLQSERASGGDSRTSNDGGTNQSALVAEGVGLLRALIDQGNPVKQIENLARLREAMAHFEPAGPSPDVQARIAGSAFIEGLKIAGRGKSGPLGGETGGASGEPSRERSKPSPAGENPGRSLLDLVREAG
jgi:hypothetical protein